MPPSASTAVPSCYRHPSTDRTTRCVLCGRALCDACTLHTPHGPSCPDCDGSPKRGLRNETSVSWRVAAGPVRSPAGRIRSPARGRRGWRLGTAIAAISLVISCGLLSPGLRAIAADRVHSIAQRVSPHRLANEVPVTTSGSYKFMHMAARLPITYDPCRTIRYELNLDEAPPGSEAVLGSAINEVERATGLRFEYVGTTHRKPLDKEPPTSRLGINEAPPVTISWATPTEAPMLAGDIAGYAGSSYMTVNGRPTHYVTGRVVLDAQTYQALVQSPNGSTEARAITMHELAHLVGLAHVDDPTELMDAENTGQLRFGPGDLAGLAQLGSGEC